MKVSGLGQTKAAAQRQKQQAAAQQQQQQQQRDGSDSDEEMLEGSDGESDSGALRDAAGNQDDEVAIHVGPPRPSGHAPSRPAEPCPPGLQRSCACLVAS
jgi:hypothetical protein